MQNPENTTQQITIDLPPFTAAIYILKRKGRVMYVGQSRNVFSRIGSHIKKNFDSVVIEWLPDNQILQREIDLIKQFRPDYNVEGITKPIRIQCVRCLKKHSMRKTVSLILAMRNVKHLTFQQIGERLGLSAGKVYALYKKARCQ